MQKESECTLLILQGESIRTIAKKLKMSFTDIGKIRKKISGEDQDHIQNKKCTKTTQALILFSQGRLPLDVSIELDMDPQETDKAYSSFLRLNRLSKIAKIAEGPDGKLMEFLEFYDFCKKTSINKDKIVYIMEKGKEISKLKNEYNILVHRKQEIKNRSGIELQNLKNIQTCIQNLTIKLEKARSDLSKLDVDINQKSRELSNLIRYIDNLKNEYNYKIYEQTLKEIFNKIISEDALKTPLIIIAFLEVFRDNPIHYKIFSYYYQIFKNGNIKENLKSKQDYIFSNFMTFIYDFSKKIHTIYRNKTIDDFHHHNSLVKSPYQNFS